MYPKHIRVLLVEKNNADIAFFKTILSEEPNIKIDVLTEKSLDDAISYCNDMGNEVDLVLADIDLGTRQGERRVKEFCEALSNWPVIILSNAENETKAMGALSAGAQDYIIKGNFERTLLLKSMVYAMERHKLKLRYEDQKNSLIKIEKRLRTIITNDTDGVLVLDYRGTIKFSNPAAEYMLGRSTEELIDNDFGIPLLDAHHRAEVEVQKQDLPPIILNMQIVRITWEGSEAYLCTLQDITANKQTEQSIKENEEKFRIISQSASDAILHFDENMHLAFFNEAAERVFELNKETCLDRDLEDVFASNPNFISFINKQLSENNGDTVSDLVCYRKNQKPFSMEISTSLFKRRGKQQIVCIVRDITARKKAEAELLDTQNELEKTLDTLKANQNKMVEVEKLKSVKELAGAISHEFTQPLQALYNYLHLIQTMGPKEDFFQKSQEMLNRISDLTTSLRNITSIHKIDYLESKILDIYASSREEIKQKGKHILVVDDEHEILETMIDIFNEAGYKCFGAENGLEAVEILNEQKVDLVISDVMMPKMDGIKLLEKVKEKDKKIPFIFLTGYDIPEQSNAEAKQADFVINKPVAFKDLLSFAEEALN